MRVSVIDVGSNTIRLMVADAERGVPLPVHTAKWKQRLSDQTDADGRMADAAVEQLAQSVAEAAATAERWGSGPPLAFATAVVRAAPNRLEVLDAVRGQTGVALCTLPGEVEAELTFLAARRWMGWRSGPLALLDIGGGSLEVALGRGSLPDFAASLPLGANRLTREFFADNDPPTPADIKALRRRVRHQLRDVATRARWESPCAAVATSRTFQQLARLCGAPPGRHGPFVHRELRRADLRRAIDDLASRRSAERADLPGISAPRARQSLAGALVAHTVMKLANFETVTICPWAVREGVLLRSIEDGLGWWSKVARDGEETLSGAAVPLRVAEPTA
ncbi:Ppx/GppA phosphatase family protein [Streptomyces cynarae]|uniref:Ppx/GppA phosphatase family protein n=1 Tax=Streptomyces cynarae TaxID=2981134 RepID=UPI00406C0149